MTTNNWKAPEGISPLLEALRDDTVNLKVMREIVLSPRAYDRACNDPCTKLCERLPICLNKSTELWEVQTKRTHLVYFVERQSDGFGRIRWIQIKDLLQATFEEYLFPQKECTENTLVID